MTLSCKRLMAVLRTVSGLAALAALTGCQTPPAQFEFQDYDPGTSWTAPGQNAEAAQPPSTPATPTAPATPPPQSSINERAAAGAATDVFRVGDVVSVTFSGTSEAIPAHQERIKEDGTITLFLVKSVKAAGKTPGELQRELQDRYDDYYKTLVVTVASFERFYYVGGEVKRPGAQPYLGETTVTKAIQAAGDFTDFAKKGNVQVIRADGTKLKVNFGKAIDDPSLDPPIYPGDKIHVPRRILW
ncbi:MAG: polysaccharide export protein [Verrucomicrobia bacterium]|jgi:polysaccharide export outer membrane protein|nr:polysaccharide export protein [Verrucomicrobiota bacterium]